MQAGLGQMRHLRRCGGGSAGGGKVTDPRAGREVTRVALKAAVAAGTYVARDLRDRDGVTRAMLRRVALRLAASERTALRGLGAGYLRRDPPV